MGGTSTRKVVIASGHRPDEDGREPPRFPPSSEVRVTREVERVAAKRWELGEHDLLITGGAAGADLIAAEAALARGCEVRLELARSRGRFVESSVAPSGPDWVRRFEAVAARSTVVESPDDQDRRYAATNERMVDIARTEAGRGAEACALLVWNGEESGRSGGTDHLARLAHRARFELYGIDPRPSPAADRVWSDGPKRLLSLDGGGVRGALSLGVLAEIETRLREATGRRDLVLSDYFDDIAGTSTGAIIATALSLGLPVEDIYTGYQEMAKRIFRRNLRLPIALHPSQPLQAVLDEIIGDRLTLGSPELRTLLTIVLHNTITDSPWPLSNNPSAKYNRPERNLSTPADRNLDIGLTRIVRGSTAAPLYFAPERIRTGPGDDDFREFQDGGVTPYNNPALLLSTMATQPEYEVGWPRGDDRLLLVSVGTGFAPVAGLHRRSIIGRLLALPGVFMGGASITQDLMARSAGSTFFGEPIDREVGDMCEGRGEFAYGRFNVDLSNGEWLTEQLTERGFEHDARRAAAILADGPEQLGKMNKAANVEPLYRLGTCLGRLFDLADVPQTFHPELGGT
jgi:hypothetical protein